MARRPFVRLTQLTIRDLVTLRGKFEMGKLAA